MGKKRAEDESRKIDEIAWCYQKAFGTFHDVPADQCEFYYNREQDSLTITAWKDSWYDGAQATISLKGQDLREICCFLNSCVTGFSPTMSESQLAEKEARRRMGMLVL